MADHQVKMWDAATTIAVVNPADRPVAKLYVEEQNGETYIEIEYSKLCDLHATDKLLTVRFRLKG